MNFTKEQQEWLDGLEKILEENDVSVGFDREKETFELNFSTPNGGDEYLPLKAEEIDDWERLSDIFGYDCDFEDEYVRDYLNAKKDGLSGVPSAGELVEDANYIMELYAELYKDISNYVVEHPYKEVFPKEQVQEKEL